MNQIIRTACHEAGHAVVAQMLGYEPRYVTIVANRDSSSHTKFPDPYEVQPTMEKRGKYRDMAVIVRARIMAMMAGREAEDFCLGPLPPDAYGDGDDRYWINLMLKDLYKPPVAFVHEVRLRRMASWLVRRHVAAIVRVAEALIVERTLRKRKLRALCGDPPRPHQRLPPLSDMSAEEIEAVYAKAKAAERELDFS